MNITNKTVLLTGGGSGIGFETAKLLSTKGNKVIIIGRNENKLIEAAQTLQNVTAIRCDITSEKDISDLIENIKENYPELSMVINNAGHAFAYTHDENAGAFEKATEEFATNYFAPIRLTEALLPVLKSQENALVVNVSSIAAFSPSTAVPSYSDSKAALHSYTLALRHTLAKNTAIKVFELMPPLVNTEFSKEIGGANGMAADDVAQGLIDGIENDVYEIQIGQTAEFRKFYLSAPTEAFEMMNQTN
jgi:uncharacterized oxidoreductase